MEINEYKNQIDSIYVSDKTHQATLAKLRSYTPQKSSGKIIAIALGGVATATVASIVLLDPFSLTPVNMQIDSSSSSQAGLNEVSSFSQSSLKATTSATDASFQTTHKERSTAVASTASNSETQSTQQVHNICIPVIWVWENVVYKNVGSIDSDKIGNHLEGAFYSIKDVPIEQSVVEKIYGGAIRFDAFMSTKFQYQGKQYQIVGVGKVGDPTPHVQGEIIGEYNQMSIYKDSKNDNFVFVDIKPLFNSSSAICNLMVLAEIIE